MSLKTATQTLFTKNWFVKPLAVVTASAPSLAYIGYESENLFDATAVPNNPDIVMVSAELLKSFHGALIMFILLLSIINIYKPNKTVIFALVFGGLALVASALLETIGLTLLTYGLGLVFNSATLSKTIIRNEKLASKKMDADVDNIIKEAQR